MVYLCSYACLVWYWVPICMCDCAYTVYRVCVADMWPRWWEERGAQRGSSERVFVSQVHYRKWKMKMKKRKNGMRGALVIGGGCHFWREINNVFLQICRVILGGRLGRELLRTRSREECWSTEGKKTEIHIHENRVRVHTHIICIQILIWTNSNAFMCKNARPVIAMCTDVHISNFYSAYSTSIDWNGLYVLWVFTINRKYWFAKCSRSSRASKDI